MKHIITVTITLAFFTSLSAYANSQPQSCGDTRLELRCQSTYIFKAANGTEEVTAYSGKSSFTEVVDYSNEDLNEPCEANISFGDPMVRYLPDGGHYGDSVDPLTDIYFAATVSDQPRKLYIYIRQGGPEGKMLFNKAVPELSYKNVISVNSSVVYQGKPRELDSVKYDCTLRTNEP